MANEAPIVVPPTTPPRSAETVAAEAARTTINVSALPSGDVKSAPPKPGSARARLFADLERKAGLTPKETPAAKPKPEESPAEPTHDETTAEEPTGEEGAPRNEDQPSTPPAQEQPAAEAPAKPGEGKRISPWKLVDQFKDRATKAEARVLELEKRVVPEEKAKQESERVKQMEARMKEMEDDLRYFNAEKYDPEVRDADKRYKDAVTLAMSELKEINITNPETKEARPVNAEDLFELVRMPLGQARQVADSVFGPFADDVMAYRNEIKKLMQAKHDKMEELKKTGATRDQDRQSRMQAQYKELQESIQKAYTEENAKVMADAKIAAFFKPKEGDTEWNNRLDAGFKFVDSAMAVNTFDPRLTADQRREAVAKYAAIRNRAASWGALRFEVTRLQGKIASLEKELKGFKETTPTAAGRSSAPANPRGNKWDAVMDGLNKYVQQR